MPRNPTQFEKGFLLKDHELGAPERRQMAYAEIPYSHTWNLQADKSSFAFDIQMKWDYFFRQIGDVNGPVVSMLGIAQVVPWNQDAVDDQPEINSFRISRVLPWKCPYFRQMWCSSLTNVKPFKYLGYDENSSDGTKSAYDRFDMTCTFASRPYDLRTDADLLSEIPYDESLRFVERLPKPTAEYISIKGNTFNFVEGTGPLKAKSHSFPNDLGLLTVKVDLEWVWHDVPDQFIMNDDKVPTGILGGMGCLNSDAIWGYPAGTLLALPPDITPHEQPYPPGLVGLPEYSQPRSWDVRFRFKFWDPPLAAGATTRGHNLAIWTREAKFALIKSVNPVGGNTTYPTYDFRKFFAYRPDSLPANP